MLNVAYVRVFLPAPPFKYGARVFETSRMKSLENLQLCILNGSTEVLSFEEHLHPRVLQHSICVVLLQYMFEIAWIINLEFSFKPNRLNRKMRA